MGIWEGAKVQWLVEKVGRGWEQVKDVTQERSASLHLSNLSRYTSLFTHLYPYLHPLHLYVCFWSLRMSKPLVSIVSTTSSMVWEVCKSREQDILLCCDSRLITVAFEWTECARLSFQLALRPRLHLPLECQHKNAKHWNVFCLFFFLRERQEEKKRKQIKQYDILFITYWLWQDKNIVSFESNRQRRIAGKDNGNILNCFCLNIINEL